MLVMSRLCQVLGQQLFAQLMLLSLESAYAMAVGAMAVNNGSVVDLCSSCRVVSDACCTTMHTLQRKSANALCCECGLLGSMCSSIGTLYCHALLASPSCEWI